MTETDASTIEGVDVDGMRAYLDGVAVEFAVLFGSHARGTADAASDVDVALKFPDDADDRERFDRRNRIDAELQTYAEEFVDVSDLGSLPAAVAHAALRDGILLTGEEAATERYRERVATEYESASPERERERREVIDRLAGGEV